MPNDLLQDRQFRLRRVGPAEYARVLEFAVAAQVAGVPPRPLHMLLGEVTKEGSKQELEGVYVVEDLTEDVIVGAAASVLHPAGCVEICGATVIRRGFGLHGLLTEVRTFHADAMNADLRYFCVVPQANAPLSQRMVALGFAPWPVPDAGAVDSVGCSLTDHDYLLLDANSLQTHVSSVLARGRNCQISHKRMADTHAALETQLMTIA